MLFLRRNPVIVVNIAGFFQYLDEKNIKALIQPIEEAILLDITMSIVIF